MRCAGEAGATFSSLFLFITSGRLERDRRLLFTRKKQTQRAFTRDIVSL